MTTLKIKLKYPFQFEGREVAELEFRRLKTGEVRRASKAGKGDEMQTAVEVAAISSGLPVEAIDEIDAADFKALSEALSEAGFFEHTT
jgi:hypothetical protein